MRNATSKTRTVQYTGVRAPFNVPQMIATTGDNKYWKFKCISDLITCTTYGTLSLTRPLKSDVLNNVGCGSRQCCSLYTRSSCTQFSPSLSHIFLVEIVEVDPWFSLTGSGASVAVSFTPCEGSYESPNGSSGRLQKHSS